MGRELGNVQRPTVLKSPNPQAMPYPNPLELNPVPDVRTISLKSDDSALVSNIPPYKSEEKPPTKPIEVSSFSSTPLPMPDLTIAPAERSPIVRSPGMLPEPILPAVSRITEKRTSEPASRTLPSVDTAMSLLHPSDNNVMSPNKGEISSASEFTDELPQNYATSTLESAPIEKQKDISIFELRSKETQAYFDSYKEGETESER